MNTQGERLKWARTRSGHTQQQIADALGVKQASINQLENGSTKEFKSTNLFPAADLIGCDARWLATGEGEAFGLSLVHDEEPLDLMIDAAIMCQVLDWIEGDYKNIYEGADNNEKAVILSELYELFADAMSEEVSTKTALRVVRLATK